MPFLGIHACLKQIVSLIDVATMTGFAVSSTIKIIISTVLSFFLSFSIFLFLSFFLSFFLLYHTSYSSDHVLF